EGIVMRGPNGSAMSVRLPSGEIETTPKETKQLKDKYKILGVPLLRGFIAFIESMIFGYGCLMESAEKSGLSDDEEEMSKFDKWINDKFGENIMTFIGIISVILGFALSFGLFIYLPIYAVDMFDKYVTGNVLSNLHPLFEGIMRIIIFIAYIAAVSQMKDIKRVFMYHGAEHKTIFCYENGEELTVENVKKYIRFHPRCGTSFIFVILIIGILLSTIVVMLFPSIGDVRWLWTLVKLLLMPIIMGIGYEFIKYAGKTENLFTKIVSAPGLWMQRLTTKEPTDDIIEVGIAALKAVINNDESQLNNTTKTEQFEDIQQEQDLKDDIAE
ncbi:MAG: DUF1385 domain-containing protein, partial [Clostridia bacterium]|nr:DUF1385 domain-containing protein [Clostridia bacterium]